MFEWSKYNHGFSFTVSGEDSTWQDSPPNVTITLGQVFIRYNLPSWLAPKINHKYGFAVHDRWLNVYYGQQSSETINERRKAFQLPWSYEIHRWDLLYPNGDLFTHNDKNLLRARFDRPKRAVYWYDVFDLRTFRPPQAARPLGSVDYTGTKLGEVYPFEWTLKGGVAQKTEVMLLGRELEWRWYWLQWLPFPRLVRRTVEFHFKDEVGERAGSWKGGLLSTSCEWRKGETMKQAFDRWAADWNGR